MEEKNLKAAGCPSAVIAALMKLEQAEERTKQLHLLSQCRNGQLDKIHRQQRKLDRLDFIIYQLKQQHGGIR